MTPGGSDEGVGDIFVLDDQGVIPNSLEFLWDTLKDSCIVVFDESDLSVHWFGSVGHSCAMDPAKALMSETHPKDRDVRSLKDLSTYSKVLEIATYFM